jgi:micrococcal nuclease
MAAKWLENQLNVSRSQEATMKRFAWALVLAVLVLGVEGRLVRAERCTGSATCTACKSCSKCSHCRSGGTCGACSPRESSQSGGVGQAGALLKSQGSAANQTMKGNVADGTVTRIVDGDTIVVQHNGKRETVRLIGVDTPEELDPRKPVQYFAKEAAEFTTGIALNRLVRLEIQRAPKDRDRYGRILAYAFRESDGLLINKEIILERYGFAYVKYPFEKMAEFREAEADARKYRRGLWGASGANPSTINRQKAGSKRSG